MENGTKPILQDGEILKVVMPSPASTQQVAVIRSKSGDFATELPVSQIKEVMGGAIQRYFYADYKREEIEKLAEGVTIGPVHLGEEAPWQTW